MTEDVDLTKNLKVINKISSFNFQLTVNPFPYFIACVSIISNFSLEV